MQLCQLVKNKGDSRNFVQNQDPFVFVNLLTFKYEFRHSELFVRFPYFSADHPQCYRAQFRGFFKVGCGTCLHSVIHPETTSPQCRDLDNVTHTRAMYLG